MVEEDTDTDFTSVIIDNGSSNIKAGFAGEDNPCSIFPTLIGRPKQQSIMISVSHHRDYRYIGVEAQNKRGVLSSTYPIENGVVNNWNDHG